MGSKTAHGDYARRGLRERGHVGVVEPVVQAVYQFLTDFCQLLTDFLISAF